MPMSQAQGAMVDRVRAMLADEPTLEEKAMFGTRSFLVRDRIAVAVFAEADLLVRVDPDDEPVLMLEPGAERAVMGAARRDMGPGWMIVRAAHLDDDERLLPWIDVAREYNRTHPKTR